MTYDYLNTLYSDIMRMLSKLVIKREDEAHGAETAETARAYELYHACVTGSRYFYSFSFFDTDILLQYMDLIRIIDMIYKHKDKYLNDCVHVTNTIAFQKTIYRG